MVGDQKGEEGCRIIWTAEVRGMSEEPLCTVADSLGDVDWTLVS
jgi:hypothetical protein